MQKKYNAKILIVDDEPAIGESVGDMLIEYGFGVERAENGKEGVKALQKESFDLLLTDIVMPDMEGIEFIRTVIKKYPRLPIIVMSGNKIGRQFLQTTMKLGARESLAKPFTIHELLEAIERCL